MAKDNQLKIMHCYTSIESKNLIEGFVKDLSDISHQTYAVIRENIMQDYIRPRDKNADFWIQRMYIGDAKIGDIMDNVFGYIAAGINWEASQTKGTKKIVEYAFEELRKLTGWIEKNPREYDYLIKEFLILKEKLERDMENKNLDRTTESVDAIREFGNFAEMIKEDPDEFFRAKDYMMFVYMAILNLWDNLYNYTHTFRLLACIARMQKWQDDAAGRIKLWEVLKKATEEWEYPYDE